jgi:hypothetical protein
MDDILLDPQHPDNGNPDLVRAFRSPGGKETPPGIVQKGFCHEVVPLGQVKVIEQNDPLKSVKVGKPFLEFRKHLHTSFKVGGTARLYRGSLALFMGGTDNSYFIKGDHCISSIL